MKKTKVWPCKIGTIPMLVIIRRGKPAVGKHLYVRENCDGSKWSMVIVDGVNPDGYFFGYYL